MLGSKHNLVYQIERIISIEIVGSLRKEWWDSMEEILQATSFDRSSCVNFLRTFARATKRRNSLKIRGRVDVITTVLS